MQWVGINEMTENWVGEICLGKGRSWDPLELGRVPHLAIVTLLKGRLYIVGVGMIVWGTVVKALAGFHGGSSQSIALRD